MKTNQNNNENIGKLFAESMKDHTIILIIKQLVKTIGNDQELGEKIRNLINGENETLSKR